jgi:hypothetical protein
MPVKQEQLIKELREDGYLLPDWIYSRQTQKEIVMAIELKDFSDPKYMEGFKNGMIFTIIMILLLVLLIGISVSITLEL